jgi:hypothetical protein
MKDFIPSTFSKKNLFFPYLFIIFLVWMSRFLLSGSFGFYEDDWFFLGTAITNSSEQNWSRLYSAYTTFFQGRPLYITFVTLIPMLSAKLGGIKTLYGIGFLILSANACLLHKVLKKSLISPIYPFLLPWFFVSTLQIQLLLFYSIFLNYKSHFYLYLLLFTCILIQKKSYVISLLYALY